MQYFSWILYKYWYSAYVPRWKHLWFKALIKNSPVGRRGFFYDAMKMSFCRVNLFESFLTLCYNIGSWYYRMNFLSPSEFPDDFLYHRKSSPVYAEYLRQCWLRIFSQKHSQNFIWWKPLLGIPSLYLFNSERSDEIPDIEALKQESHAKHGLIIWVPYKNQIKPKGWKEVPAPTHFVETGFTRVDEDYKKKWSQRARRAEKKFLKSGATLSEVSKEEFIEAFKKAKFLPLLKPTYIKFYTRMKTIDPSSVRQWLVYDPSGKSIAGLAVHDFNGDQSVHMVAFTTKEAYPYQAGTGLIAKWFDDSLQKNIKYIWFDQLRQKWGPADQKWYSEFKMNFIENRMSFKKSYYKFF